MPQIRLKSARRRKVFVVFLILTLLAGTCWVPYRNWKVRSLLRIADFELLVNQSAAAAEATSRKLLWYSPDHAQGLLILGIALSKQKKFTEAISCVERVPSDSPFYSEAVLTLCECLLSDGQYRRADLLLQKSLQTYPDSSSLTQLAYNLYKSTYRLRKAIETLEQSLRYTPADEGALRTLLDLQTGVISPGALSRQLLRDCPRWQSEPDVLAALGQASILQGEANLAESYFQQALHLDPTNPRIQLWCSDLYLSMDQVDMARTLLQSFDQAEESMHSTGNWIHSEYWRLKSILLEREGDAELALKYCNESLRLYQQPECLSLKAGILRKLSRPDQAEATSRQLIQLGKLDFELLKLGSGQSRISLSPELCEQLGIVFSGLGRHSQAKAWHTLAKHLSGNPR
ncbi:MAG: tetratricopeptide repeat protein [Rhodopirellula sp.]|nr:tetratricopeptide repeat protein [Rhodopirellula sp.]